MVPVRGRATLGRSEAVRHTSGMTLTTIKVESQLRDVLKRQAQLHGRTLGEHLEALAAAEERRARFDAMRTAMQQQPPDASYREQSRAWQSDAWS